MSESTGSATMTPQAERTIRKHSRPFLARRIVQRIREHPGNAGATKRALVRAASWQARKKLGQGPVHVTAYGLDLELPRHSGSLSNFFYFGECFEWETLNFVRSYVKAGDVVVDVGANVGMFTYAALECVGPTGLVHSFEPLDWAAAAIRRNVELNRLTNVHVHELAASDRHGEVMLASDLDVSSHIERESGTTSSQRSTRVRTERLDFELAALRGIALAKVDVEGAEALALRGFSDHLGVGDPPVIIFEAHDHSLRKMGSSRDEVLTMLTAFDYELFQFRVASACLVPASGESTGDLIAVLSSAAAKVQGRLVAPTSRS